MNFNIFKKIFSFSSPSSVSSEDQTKNEEVACKSPFIIPLKRDPNAYEDNARAFDEKIDVCKEHANPEKYFGLFAKHLKKFENGGLGKKIALIDLSNIVVDKMIINLNPKAEYVLIDNFLDYNLLKALAPEASLSLIYTDDDGILKQLEKLQKLNIDMKFDVVVGNPPYDRSLHLKILAEAMKHLSDEGEVVWLAPTPRLTSIRNLYDEKTIARNSKILAYKHLKTCERVNNAIKLFSAGIQQHLSISKYTLKETSKDVNFKKWVSSPIPIDLLCKIMKKCMDNTILKKQQSGEFVLPISDIHGHVGQKDFLNIMSNTYARQLKSIGRTKVRFKTDEDRHDFYDFWNSKLGRFLVSLWKVDTHVEHRYIPYAWFKTKDEFFKFFNLTGDEIKLIEETIKD